MYLLGGKVELFGGVEDKLLIQFEWDESHKVHCEVDDDVGVEVADQLRHVDVLVLLVQDLFSDTGNDHDQ
jgi:hypothetical protein